MGNTVYMSYVALLFSPIWMVAFFCIALFFLGAAVASFFNVVRVRQSWRQSLGGRSHCPMCQKVLTWRELIPVFSYVSLRGRCSACRGVIAPHHMSAELLLGFLFVFVFLFADSLFVAGVGMLAAVFLTPMVLEGY